MYVQVIIYRHTPRIKTQMVMQFSNYIEIQHVWTNVIAFQQLAKKNAIGLWAVCCVAFAVTVALVADLADINVGIVVVVVVDDGVLISLLMLLTFLMTRSGVVINQIKPMGNARVQNLLARRWSAPGGKQVGKIHMNLWVN